MWKLMNILKIDLREYAADGGRFMGYAMGSTRRECDEGIRHHGPTIKSKSSRCNRARFKRNRWIYSSSWCKEKADDIPAMLSNNEFVFTADAVRAMGDGDVNKGAERMYSMMKTLENGGRV